jgi:uncharacterized cupin superfamily protein
VEKRGKHREKATPALVSTAVSVFNLFGDAWDEAEEQGGFSFRGASVGRRLGSELIGGSVYEVEPGKKLWPYHLHHSNEEWMIVLRGRPTLRTPDGESELTEGDTACFLRGPSGAHQVINRTDTPVRVLMLSTYLMPELVEYPDSGKVGTRDAKGERLFLSRPGPTLEYWDGET